MSLLIEGLNVRYGKSHVIFDLDLEVGEGEVLALLGRNGAGKTTTIMGIVGLLPGATGKVVVGGADVSRKPAFRRARAGIAYVPSGARCFPNLTVQENLEIAARESGNGDWDKDRVYDLFPKLQALRVNLAAGLSGGERQMLAVGRALMSNPRAILFDEPTEGLAPVVVQGLGELMKNLKGTGVAVLLAEQNHHMALRAADRAAFMEKGRVVEQLPASEARGSEVLNRILGL
ncbi:MAG TPA: ABC transporter ATP-binding protein [Candidatus Dormibacteraeota bacterium]|nr:ABC transporter ATP-binding protein [Candidatus Dormibacteraeota bacterium]